MVFVDAVFSAETVPPVTHHCDDPCERLLHCAYADVARHITPLYSQMCFAPKCQLALCLIKVSQGLRLVFFPAFTPSKQFRPNTGLFPNLLSCLGELEVLL